MATLICSLTTDCWLSRVVIFALWICAISGRKWRRFLFIFLSQSMPWTNIVTRCAIFRDESFYPLQSAAKKKNIVIIFRVAIMFGFAAMFTRNPSLLVSLSVFVFLLLASPKKEEIWFSFNFYVKRKTFQTCLRVVSSHLISVFNQLSFEWNILDVWLTAFGSNLRFLTTCEYQVDPLRLETALEALHNPRRMDRYINAESHDILVFWNKANENIFWI